MEEVGKGCFTLVGALTFTVVVILVIGAIFGLPIYLLWNWLMPEIFGIKEITFWQAIGIGWLSGCLFRSSVQTSKKE